MQRDATQVDATLRLLDEDGAELGDRGSRVSERLELGGLEQRSLQLLVDVSSEIPRGRVAAIEVLLLGPDGERIVGSLGVALTGG